MLTLRIEGAPERLIPVGHGDDPPLRVTWTSHHLPPIGAPIITLTSPPGLVMTGMVGLHALIAVTTSTQVVDEVTYLYM